MPLSVLFAAGSECMHLLCVCVGVCFLQISSVFEDINENGNGVIHLSSSGMSALTCVFETRKRMPSRKTFGLAQSHLSSLFWGGWVSQTLFSSKATLQEI